jgi:hypothetical protein
VKNQTIALVDWASYLAKDNSGKTTAKKFVQFSLRFACDVAAIDVVDASQSV